MQADEHTRTVVHREWILPTPAHHTEVLKALTVAAQKHDAEPGHPSDIAFTHGDDEIVIGYSVERHPDVVAGVADQILRRERDGWRLKAEVAMATVKRVRQLAIEWSAATGIEASAWHGASMLLHETLDGPGDEPAADQ